MGTILDYKSSRRPKPPEWIYGYKLQIAAYACAHAEMFGEDIIDQGVILIAIRPDVSKGPQRFQRFIIDRDELDARKLEWAELVDRFYAE